MIPATVFLGGSTADAALVQALAQALDGLGMPVDAGSPPPQSSPAEPGVAPSAVVLVLSAPALALPDFMARLAAYEALTADEPATVVIPVVREPLPAEGLPSWLRQYQPLAVSGDSPETQEHIIRAVLRRLGMDWANPADDTSEVTPAPLDTESPDTAVVDTVRLAIPPTTAPSGTVSPDSASLDTIRLAVPPPEAAALDTVPLPATPQALISGQPSPGTLVGAPVATPFVMWRQRVERHRRPIALGVVSSLLLLLIACVVFSLGVGAPGGQGADRLDAGLVGGSNATLASATPSLSASALPSVSATTSKPSPTVLRLTPKAAVPTPTAVPISTVVPPTATPVPPTPTPPIPGLHGDYFHSTKITPGTPVPYPDPIFGAPWFSRTDTIIDMGYGNQSHTYTPPEKAFDAQVCPAPPTSSPCAPFAVRWTGFVQAQYSEAYTFTTDSDDGVKLWINGQLVVDDWQIQGDTPTQSAPFNLTANQLLPIQIEYYENGQGPATMVLQWHSASQPTAVIPPSAFYLPG